MVMQASYESSKASFGLFQLISIHPPHIDEQICPGVEHLSTSMSRVGPQSLLLSVSRGGARLNPISRAGTSLTLHVQWWNMSGFHNQG